MLTFGWLHYESAQRPWQEVSPYPSILISMPLPWKGKERLMGQVRRKAKETKKGQACHFGRGCKQKTYP